MCLFIYMCSLYCVLCASACTRLLSEILCLNLSLELFQVCNLGQRWIHDDSGVLSCVQKYSFFFEHVFERSDKNDCSWWLHVNGHFWPETQHRCVSLGYPSAGIPEKKLYIKVSLLVGYFLFYIHKPQIYLYLLLSVKCRVTVVHARQDYQ